MLRSALFRSPGIGWLRRGGHAAVRTHSCRSHPSMKIDQLQQEFERVQAELSDGPIVPSVTVDEIRSHLNNQYDFQNGLPLDEVVEDAERMLRTWQVQVTH